MRRIAALVLAIAGLALATVVTTAGTAPSVADAKAKRCKVAQKPTHMKLARKRGSSVARLRWRAPVRRPAGARYRVYRNGRTVGQTTRRSMSVRVSPGRSYRFKIAVVGTGCAASKRIAVKLRRPSTPKHLAAGDSSGSTVRVSWSRSRRGESPVAGYRLFRDGKVYGQSRGTARTVPIASNRSYRFTVAAVDRQGRLSARSAAITVRVGHRAPPTPSVVDAVAVDDATVGVTWDAVAAPRAKVTGYRVLRDGRVVTQVKGTSAVVSNLAASTTYRFQVQAVDSLGYVSDPSAVVAARTQDPVPSTGKAHAWLLASTTQSFTDFRANYDHIGWVYPTYFDCTAAGALHGADDPLVTSWARARKVRVLPRVNCQRTQTVHAILTDASLRAQWLAAMLALVDSHGYDGIALDFEAGPASDRAAMTSFAAELAAGLHARGKELSQAVSAKFADNLTHPRSGIFDYPQLAQHVDNIFVMAWGIHWATSGPGASDDLGWVTSVANYVATMPNRHRFVLGAHLYAMDWKDGGGPSNPGAAMEYSEVLELIARLGVAPVHDPVADAYTFSYTDSGGAPHEVWFGDHATVARRLQLAKDRGLGGAGFWRLGREDQRIWSDPLLAPGAVWP